MVNDVVNAMVIYIDRGIWEIETIMADFQIAQYGLLFNLLNKTGYCSLKYSYSIMLEV
jgi:hypothetical protein